MNLKSRWPVAIGGELELHVEIPGRKLRVEGVVVGCQQDEWHPGTYDLSVFFVGLDRAKTKRVEQFSKFLA